VCARARFRKTVVGAKPAPRWDEMTWDGDQLLLPAHEDTTTREPQLAFYNMTSFSVSTRRTFVSLEIPSVMP
jgi:hypothetical protein